MGNAFKKVLHYLKKDEAVNISDIKLSLPTGLKIRDKREIFMLKFPLYQMEVMHFQILLKKLYQKKSWTLESELYEIFKDIELLEQTWPRMKLLLKAKVFQYE